MSVCGPDFAEGPTCCGKEEILSLDNNFGRVEGLIAACPACRNNFRSLFCSFTCSPNQSSFINITSTQRSSTKQIAVASVDFFLSPEQGQAFYDSCKDVQLGSANLFAMDVIGNGAKNYTSFLKYLGDEQPAGSPFQINFPLTTPPEYTPLNTPQKRCSDPDLLSRCSCIDCPAVCPVLPPVPAPSDRQTCHVGILSCLSFILILAYTLAILGFVFGYFIETAIRKRREKAFEQVALSAESAGSPRTHPRGLVGAGSLAQYLDEDSLGTHSESRHLGRGASLLDPIETLQPRHYPLNAILRKAFFRLGMLAAAKPWLTFTIVFSVVAVMNAGWQYFEVETDPVRLWVAPSSESKQQKEFFDANFGPFYRTEQIFVTTLPGIVEANYTSSLNPIVIGQKAPVLSWSHLKYWLAVETEIRELVSPNGYTLSDVCFKPAGEDGPCVVQSPLAWFGNDLSPYSKDTWEEHLLECANSPGGVSCLPDFQQPLGPQYVLGGVPSNEEGYKAYLNAEAMVITFVVLDSLDRDVQRRAMEWEETLRLYLLDLSNRARWEAGLDITFSTGVSLEQEINKSTNTDVKIVILSYLAMFFYVSFTLGSGSSTREEEGLVSSLATWAVNFPRLFLPSRHLPSSISIDSRNNPRFFPRLPRSLFVDSKFTLGLFGIILVILSVSSSVGFFSFIGVKVTLIIAEVIPFLVLAVGVDNVFLLVHELDRQNLMHGPNAAFGMPPGSTFNPPMSPSRSPFGSTHDDIDASSLPLYLPAEERIARALAKMGPSILLSTITETTAFALGALVPMPAVRNFALYAAGSVLLNAALQVTVFVSAMALDLRRAEVS